MNEKRMKETLETIARHNIPENINLWPNISTRLERKSLMMKLRTRPFVAMLIGLLILLTLSGMVYALGRVLGYIPGVGIVEQSIPLRTLREAVVMERDGITVKVYQVVVNAEYTFVDYALNGIIMPKQGIPLCGASPSLKLPDGSTLEILSGGSGGFGSQVGEPVGFETTVYYPPLPVDVDQVTFVLDCILAKGTGPEDWQLPLVLLTFI